MANIVDIFSYRPRSYHVSLRRFYRELERTPLPSPRYVQECKIFFIQTRGKFLSISRKKKNISLQDAAVHVGIPGPALEAIEKGDAPIYNESFLRLCKLYGTLEESLILSKKMEKVLMLKYFPTHSASALEK